jgi:sugar phosphate isomerase/epimerase
MIPLGASTLGYRFDTLDVALREIAGQGFDLVDVDMIPVYCPHFNPLEASEEEQESLQALLASLGLAVATLNVSDGLFGNSAVRERQMAFVRASLRLAQRLGAYGVTTQSGVEPAPGEWRQMAEVVAPDVRRLGDEARDLGLELTLELHKSMLMATRREAVDLMALVDHPQVGVAIDPSHATHAGENIAEIARALGDRVKHVHLRDGVGKNIMVVPGDGTVDFVDLARVLGEIDYQRAAVIELEYADARAPEVRPDLARARAFLADAFASV